MDHRSVMLVDHDQLFSAALRSLLETEGLIVDGPFNSLRPALAQLEDGVEPDILIVDPAALAPPGHRPPDRTEVLRCLRASAPGSAIVVLTADLSDAAIADSLAVEAKGHLSKDSRFAALRQALLLVGLGQSVFPQRALGLLAPQPVVARPAGNGELSRRETQILGCLLSGLSNKEIARRLDITESTVKMHFKNVLRKIQAANRTQAAVWAIENGIAPLP